MTARTCRISLIFVGVVVALIPIIILASMPFVLRTSEYRISFPAKKPLTEQDAVELTRQAMLLDGKRTDTMRPVSSGHKDADGRDVFFLRRDPNSDEGCVFWWLERPTHEWEYSVGIHREGDEVVCIVVTPH